MDKTPSGFTDGFELADFDKFNSYASENGLGGTKIYLNCVLDKIKLLSSDAGVLGFLTDENNNEWVSILHMQTFVSPNEFDSIVGKPIVLCGTYMGFSDTYKMPNVDLYALCVRETGEIKSGYLKVMSSLENYTDPKNGKNETAINDKTNKETHNKTKSDFDFKSASGIESYLHETYPPISILGDTWNFDYQVIVPTYGDGDYMIYLKYDRYQMANLNFTIGSTYTDEEKEEVKAELKNFMKTLAIDLIDKLPDKKIRGFYYEGHYKYPHAKLEYVSEVYCNWANYDSENGKISSFRWLPRLDTEKW